MEESYPKREEFTGVGGRQGEQLLLMEEAEATGVVERLLLMRGLEFGHQSSKCTWNLACVFVQEVLTPSPIPHLPLWSMGFSHFIQVYPLSSSSWEPRNPLDLDLSATINLSGTTLSSIFFCLFVFVASQYVGVQGDLKSLHRGWPDLLFPALLLFLSSYPTGFQP